MTLFGPIGADVRQAGRRRPLYDEQAIRERFSETNSVRRIQVEFGMSWSTANKTLIELGLK